MRRIYTYILALLTLSVACQRVDLPEDSPINQPTELPTGAIGSKATITFSTADLTGSETRGVLDPNVQDPTTDIKTLHLIVFDENGMLVEVCEAKELGNSDHVDPETGETHKGGRHYTVTLTVTDEPRIIHYVANCPVDQVVYGHETSIIGNMFVDRNGSEGAKTVHEVSYWARIEVPCILVEEKEVTQADGTKKKVISLVDEIEHKFKHVPLLRNYAEITVLDNTEQTDFEFIGFTVYNLLDRGTVAPYNSNKQKFQSFTYIDPETEKMKNYSYPQISSQGYEGHALTSAQLITDFIRNDDGTIKIYDAGQPFYVYERKVSVMTDEEEKWRESPPHIIIKGRYNHGKQVTDASPIYYYKMDLVYRETDANGNEEIKYYNILRNFKYKFTLTQVNDEGYTSLDLAVAGAAGNNISGSSSTSKLTNVSDDAGRLWVSYTDITLVTNKDVTFRYKYIPNYYGVEEHQYTKDEIHNELVRFENTTGDVITGFNVATTDVTSGEYAGWREVTISVNTPDDIIRQQIVSLKTDNSNLNRQIRHTLRKKLTMQVECTPKVKPEIKQGVQVDIKLPAGMTDDMFPLSLNMETYDRTLSPDATKNSIPVTAGTSIIDTDDRRETLSYYYTVTIPTIDDYKRLPSEGNMKVYTTHWLTNKADNASTFYVDNKYFTQGYDIWENYQYEFSNVECSTAALGVGKDVTIKFTMANGAINTPVTISLNGMTYNGKTTWTHTPSQNNVIITGLKTTTDTEAVSFTLDADNYNIASAEGARLTYKFNGRFVGATSLEAAADVEVDFTFNISPEALEALRSLNKLTSGNPAPVPMFVTLNRMHPADDQLTVSQAKAEGDRYIYLINEAGPQTIRLATTEDAGGPCTVTLQADYFDTETVTIYQTDIKVMFNSWVKSTNNSVTNATRDYVYTNEKVRYYVNVSADNAPTSVTIDGISATRSGTFTGSGASNTTWYVEWSKSTAGTYPMTATVVVDGQTCTQALGNMTVVKRNVTVGFNSWEDTSDTSINNNSTRGDFVVVGENVRYYVNVSADEDPSSVTINDKSATKVATRSGESNTTWYIEYSNSTMGNQTISVKVSFTGDDNTYSENLTLKVAGISLGTATTSPNTNGTEYVMQNTAYTKTYCTSAGTNLSASTTLDYNSLFTIEANGNSRRIKSVAKGTYCSGSSNKGSVLFNTTGTTYTFGNGYIYTGDVYMRQSSNTNVTFGNNKSTNRTWSFYPVTYNIPK